MNCVGGKVLYEFFTSDIVGFLVSAHVDCIVLRQEYLADTDSGAKPTLYISFKKKSTLFSSLQNFSEIQNPNGQRYQKIQFKGMNYIH